MPRFPNRDVDDACADDGRIACYRPQRASLAPATSAPVQDVEGRIPRVRAQRILVIDERPDIGIGHNGGPPLDEPPPAPPRPDIPKHVYFTRRQSGIILFGKPALDRIKKMEQSGVLVPIRLSGPNGNVVHHHDNLSAVAAIRGKGGK